jgi:hypothetical protein
MSFRALQKPDRFWPADLSLGTLGTAPDFCTMGGSKTLAVGTVERDLL